MTSRRIRCTECDWMGVLGQQLTAPNPFDPSEEIVGCPSCHEPNSFELLCEVDGCTREASCGTSVPGDYAQTCGKHMPKEGAKP